MQYLRYLGQLSYNPILILVMALVGLILSTFVKSLVQLAFAKPMGMKVTDIMIFGLKYTKLKNGKWEKRGRKAGVGLQVETAFDLEREAGMDSRKLIAKDKAYMILTAVVTLLIGIGAFAGLLIATFNVDSYLLASVLFLLGFWLLLFLIGKFFLAISVVSKVNSKKSLSGYTQEVLSMLRSGVPFEQMEMKPFSELNYKKVWDTEKQMYFLLYFEYLDANGFFDRMPEAVRCRLDEMLKRPEKSVLSYPLATVALKKDMIMLPDSRVSATSSDLAFAVSAMLPDSRVKCQWRAESNHYGLYTLKSGMVISNKEYITDAYGIDRETETSKADARYTDKYHRLYDVPVGWILGKNGSEKYVVSVPYPNGKNGFGKIFVPAEDVDFNSNGRTAKVFLRGETTDVYYRPPLENVTSIDRMYNGDLVHLRDEMSKKHRQQRLMAMSVSEVPKQASEFAIE